MIPMRQNLIHLKLKDYGDHLITCALACLLGLFGQCYSLLVIILVVRRSLDGLQPLRFRHSQVSRNLQDPVLPPLTVSEVD
jgi:hypothetical protein